MSSDLKPVQAAALGFGFAVLCGVVWKTVTTETGFGSSSSSSTEAKTVTQADAPSAREAPSGKSSDAVSPAGAAETVGDIPPPPPVLKKVDGGKDEGFIEEIVACISRACKIYSTLDEFCLDAIIYSQVCELVARNQQATHVLHEAWSASKKGPITCNEFLQHFLLVKSHYGQECLNSHLKAFEDGVAAAVDAADAAAPSGNITIRAGKKGRKSVGGGEGAAAAGADNTEAQRQDLPSSWLPVLSTRIASIFRRIDLNGDHTIDKEEILALHGGDRATTDSMFADLDTDGDGTISPQEFLEYFLRLLKRCEDKDKAKSSPMRVNDMGNLEKGSPQMPTKGTGHKMGASITKGRKMVNKIMAILEQKLTERDDRLHY